MGGGQGRLWRGARRTGFIILLELAHRHAIELNAHGFLRKESGRRRAVVHSVHEQGIDRLGAGLTVEAVASDDRLVEAISARPCGGNVQAVQWHSEWDTASCAQPRLLRPVAPDGSESTSAPR